MTPENERLVRQSWKQFEPMAVASAAFFYEKLFELDPDARPLFARTDMEAQGRKVMHMFAEIVRSLDRPEQLVPEVADLGRRHVHYGVRDDQYGSVGTALLWTLERVLGGVHPGGKGRVDRGLPPVRGHPAAGRGSGSRELPAGLNFSAAVHVLL